MLAFRPKSKNLRAYSTIALSTTLLVFSLIYVIAAFDISRLRIIRSTSQIIIPVLSVFVASAGLWSIGRHIKLGLLAKRILIGLVIFLLALVGLQQSIQYRGITDDARIVDEYDVVAYEWINNNIEDASGFLNNAIRSDVRSHIIR